MRKMLFALALCTAVTAAAQQYARLDTTFNQTGTFVLDSFIQGLPQISFKHALQSDGKIVLCGNRMTGFFVSDIVLARLKPNGRLDSTFGQNGIRTFAVYAGGQNSAYGVAIQPDGRIVTGGLANDGTNANELFMARLSANGTLDATFGTGGIGKYDVNEEYERMTDMKLQPNGKILMSGIASTSTASDSSFILRVKANGSRDSSFAGDGIFRFQFGGAMTNLYAIDVHPNGKIVAGGSYNNPNNYQDYLLVRLDSNGVRDNTFGTSGIFAADHFFDYDELHAVRILADESVIAAGYSYNGNNDGVTAIRLTAGGLLATSFGAGGKVYVGDAALPMRGYSMQVQADGKIVIGGEKSTGNGTDDFMLLRLTAAGVPDTGFSPFTGYLTNDFFGDNERVHSVTIQPDGRILAYGTTIKDIPSQESQPIIARYIVGPYVVAPPTAVLAAVNDNDIRLYPSPVTGNTLHIAVPKGHGYDCYLYTNTGALVHQAGLAAGTGAIELPGSVADGVYFLVLKDVQDRSVSRHTIVVRRN